MLTENSHAGGRERTPQGSHGVWMRWEQPEQTSINLCYSALYFSLCHFLGKRSLRTFLKLPFSLSKLMYQDQVLKLMTQKDKSHPWLVVSVFMPISSSSISANWGEVSLLFRIQKTHLSVPYNLEQSRF